MAKNYWLHRISHCSDVSHPLLEENYLSIGFADFCSDQILNTGFLTDWEAFEKEFERVSIDVWGCVKSHRSRFSLWRFVNSMKAGDWVIVPTYKKFHIYEIKSELLYPKDIDCLSKLKTERPVILNEDNLLSFDNGEKEHIDLGFFRKVKSIKNDISRYQFADNALFSRMKIRSTNANIVDIKESIEKVIKALENNRPISLFNDILNMSQDVIKLIQSEMQHGKFEELIKWYFLRIGASDVIIPPPNESGKEGDADIIARFDLMKIIIYIQAKFHEGTTSDFALEQVESYKNKKAENTDDVYSQIAWVISTGDTFSEESKEKALKYKIQLINGVEFAEMILQAGILNLSDAFPKD